MPTSVPLSKRIELTIVFELENFARLLAVPPVVVTVEVASGEMAGAIAGAGEALVPARQRPREAGRRVWPNRRPSRHKER